MKITTRDFGELEINDNTIITMPNGIIGFENTKHYTLISPLGEDKFPMWLQSTEAPEPCFVVYDPMQLCDEYRFEISDEEQELLGIDENSPYRVLVVAIVPDDYRKTTVNLRCPIIINTKTSVAAQVLLLEHYDFKCPIYEEGN